MNKHGLLHISSEVTVFLDVSWLPLTAEVTPSTGFLSEPDLHIACFLNFWLHPALLRCSAPRTQTRGSTGGSWIQTNTVLLWDDLRPFSLAQSPFPCQQSETSFPNPDSSSLTYRKDQIILFINFPWSCLLIFTAFTDMFFVTQKKIKTSRILISRDVS